MSPSKKKATAKKSGAKAKPSKSTKKPAAKKKAKSSKSAAKKTKPRKAAKAAGKAKSAAKTTAKKAAKKKAAKAPAKKASAKKPAEKSAAKKPQKSPAQAAPTAAKKAPAKAAAAAASSTKTKSKIKASAAKAKSESKPARSTKRARPRKPVLPTGPRHPKLGYKWTCFGCGAKFYDLGKEEPLCPKCETDQRERPPEDSKPSVEAPKAKAVRPMAQLLDYEEPVATRDEEIHSGAAATKENEMFDEAESDAAGLDIDDVDQADGGQEPPEIDVL